MMQIDAGDAVEWARQYKGAKFHALFCDPPYHLTSITERFGKSGSAPAQFGRDGAFSRVSAGFMGQSWDGGDVAFRVETWKAFGELLYPGAFGIAFAGTRGYHRMVVAIEDAGFIIHPMLGWLHLSAFPKATRIDKKLDGDLARDWAGHRYGLQAIKPVLEPICVFQKPYDGRPVDNIVSTGAGALNIDGTRVGTGDNVNGGAYAKTGTERNDEGGAGEYSEPTGRWTPNQVLEHHPDCRLVGYRSSGDYQINRWGDNAHPFGGGAGNEYGGVGRLALLDVWECVDGCPVKMLNEKSGDRSVGKGVAFHKKSTKDLGYKPRAYGSESRDEQADLLYGDDGEIARMMYQAGWELDMQEQLAGVLPLIEQSKAANSEKDAGLENENHHPTIKPLALTKYLATLLLPPARYAPNRRIFVPFAGTGSEMIGAMLAGWDEIIGVELETDHVTIAEQRFVFWEREFKRGKSDPARILKKQAGRKPAEDQPKLFTGDA